jgi:hypothetical protein
MQTSNFTDGSLSGIVTVGSGRTSFIKTLSNNLTTDGLQTFVVNLRTGSSSGPIVATSSLISVFDTSQSSATPTIPPISTYAEWTSQAVIGSNVNILGSNSTVYTLAVVADPVGTKSLSFPVTWPSSSFISNNQNINYSFTMSAANHTIMSNVTYIFNGRTFGVYPISGASEACCDPYSMTFSGVSLFSLRGSNTNTYQTVTLGSTLSSNSGIVNFTTDISVNGGNGLFGASGNFYLK